MQRSIKEIANGILNRREAIDFIIHIAYNKKRENE